MLINFEKGQSLWEIVIALSIAGIIALGLIKLTTSAVRNSGFSRDQGQVTNLAKKRIAEVITYKNTNPNEFWANFPFLPPSIPASQLIDGFCLLTELSEPGAGEGLPSSTPNWAQARMAKITVDVLWEQAGSSGSCLESNYKNKLHFETFVTN